MDSHEKYRNLLDYPASLQFGIVSFSGGVDSSFLPSAISDAGGERIIGWAA
jgi:PP-loop superfamily ATP-utilizing enzyme